MGHVQNDCKQIKDEEGKGKEKDFMYITESDGSNALISPWLSPASHGLLTPVSLFMHFPTKYLSKLCERWT